MTITELADWINAQLQPQAAEPIRPIEVGAALQALQLRPQIHGFVAHLSATPMLHCSELREKQAPDASSSVRALRTEVKFFYVSVSIAALAACSSLQKDVQHPPSYFGTGAPVAKHTVENHQPFDTKQVTRTAYPDTLYAQARPTQKTVADTGHEMASYFHPGQKTVAASTPTIDTFIASTPNPVLTVPATQTKTKVVTLAQAEVAPHADHGLKVNRVASVQALIIAPTPQPTTVTLAAAPSVTRPQDAKPISPANPKPLAHLPAHIRLPEPPRSNNYPLDAAKLESTPPSPGGSDRASPVRGATAATPPQAVPCGAPAQNNPHRAGQFPIGSPEDIRQLHQFDDPSRNDLFEQRVTFAPNGTRLTEETKQYLAALKDAAMAADRIQLRGRVASHNVSDTNDRIAVSRAMMVRAGLIAMGVPAEKIRVRLPRKGDLVDTSSVRSEANRSVSIFFMMDPKQASILGLRPKSAFALAAGKPSL